MKNGEYKSDYIKWIVQQAPKVKDRDEFIIECMRKFRKKRRLVMNTISFMERFGKIPLLRGPCKKSSSVSQRRGSRGGIMRLSVDVSEISDEYDEESKIMRGIEALGTRLIKDNDFRMELGVPVDRWKVATSLAKFNPYKKELRGKRFKGVYWGNPEVIKQLAKKIEML